MGRKMDRCRCQGEGESAGGKHKGTGTQADSRADGQRDKHREGNHTQTGGRQTRQTRCMREKGQWAEHKESRMSGGLKSRHRDSQSFKNGKGEEQHRQPRHRSGRGSNRLQQTDRQTKASLTSFSREGALCSG